MSTAGAVLQTMLSDNFQDTHQINTAIHQEQFVGIKQKMMKRNQPASAHCFTDADDVRVQKSSTHSLQQRILQQLLKKQIIQSGDRGKKENHNNDEVRNKNNNNFDTFSTKGDDTSSRANLYSLQVVVTHGGYKSSLSRLDEDDNTCHTQTGAAGVSQRIHSISPEDQSKKSKLPFKTVVVEAPTVTSNPQIKSKHSILIQQQQQKSTPQSNSLTNLFNRISNQLQTGFQSRWKNFHNPNYNNNPCLPQQKLQQQHFVSEDQEIQTGTLINKCQNPTIQSIHAKKKGCQKHLFQSKDENAFTVPKNQFQYHYSNNTASQNLQLGGGIITTTSATLAANNCNHNRNSYSKTLQHELPQQSNIQQQQQQQVQYKPQRKRSQAISLLNGGPEDLVIKLLNSHRNPLENMNS